MSDWCGFLDFFDEGLCKWNFCCIFAENCGLNFCTIMKKLFVVFSLLAVMSLHAQEAVRNAVYAWVDGSSTCYRLSEMPKVTYEGQIAILSIRGEEQLRVDLGEKELILTFGEYQTTAVDETTAPVEQVGKYIRGGQLIIVRDGVQYDVTGRIITK